MIWYLFKLRVGDMALAKLFLHHSCPPFLLLPPLPLPLQLSQDDTLFTSCLVQSITQTTNLESRKEEREEEREGRRRRKREGEGENG